MIRRRTTNTPEEDALEDWAASDEPAVRDDATITSPTEGSRTHMRELLTAAATPEQLEEVTRTAERAPSTRS